jgi:hypothetical protein
MPIQAAAIPACHHHRVLLIKTMCCAPNIPWRKLARANLFAHLIQDLPM